MVYYQRLLVTLLGTSDDSRPEREELNLDSLDKLRRLEKVDSMRGARYRDLGKSGRFCWITGLRMQTDCLALESAAVLILPNRRQA